MIRINLLGQPRPKKVRAGGAPLEGTLQVAFLVVALVVGAGFLGVHYNIQRRELAGYQKEITGLTAERTRLQGIKAEVDRRQQEKAALKQRIDVIEQLQRSRSGGQELLDALANTVNRVDALWMNGLKRTGNTLQMDGAADSLNAVASFITELKRSGYFDKVEIKETKQDERHPNATTFIFTLMADFMLPSQGDSAQQAPAKPARN
ncbi:MAG TPA: PilN domain-containing protein [Candidatus Acidoferrales bacterium]|nr:PilN domain-containing protein [Candidatus Acidoferrales bacterium]